LFQLQRQPWALRLRRYAGEVQPGAVDAEVGEERRAGGLEELMERCGELLVTALRVANVWDSSPTVATACQTQHDLVTAGAACPRGTVQKFKDIANHGSGTGIKSAYSYK
jgi:hypothetical protein